ncbi:hypothetical protein EMIT0196MI5_40156 [Pseudomonas sp. IT-196MI5]
MAGETEDNGARAVDIHGARAYHQTFFFGCSDSPLWRGSLLPLGREAAPKNLHVHCVDWFYDCFAAEREQAPSPQ